MHVPAWQRMEEMFTRFEGAVDDVFQGRCALGNMCLPGSPAYGFLPLEGARRRAGMGFSDVTQPIPLLASLLAGSP